MNSEPSFILMHPNTLKIIALIRDFRKQTAIPVCFTLDAGPNIHLLYREDQSAHARQFKSDYLVGNYDVL